MRTEIAIVVGCSLVSQGSNAAAVDIDPANNPTVVADWNDLHLHEQIVANFADILKSNLHTHFSTSRSGGAVTRRTANASS